MRLAIFWSEILHYHAARIVSLATLARERGDSVYAVAIRSESPELPFSGYHELLGDRIEILNTLSRLEGMESFQSKRRLLKKLDQRDPDAVAIIGYDSLVSRAALGWCRYHGRGAILMLESQAKDTDRVAWKEVVKAGLVSLYDSVLTGGKAQAAYASELGVPKEHIFTGYDVVDNAFWSQRADMVRSDPGPWRERYPLPRRYFLTACRFVPKKNLQGLLSAYASYVAQTESEPWPLVIVGDGPLFPALRSQVASLGLQSKVHFLGYLSADDMAPVYALASVFILASAYSEQWGLVVNEAMAAGLPVLVSNVCGCVPDLVTDGVTGFSFDPSDEKQLAGLLVQVSSGVVDLQTLGCCARERIGHYTPLHFARNLFAAAEVANTHASSRRWSYWPSPNLWL